MPKRRSKRKHYVTCVRCGQQFDANRGFSYDRFSRRYTCLSCTNEMRLQQKRRDAQIRLKKTGMKQTKGEMVAKIVFGMFFVFCSVYYFLASESKNIGYTLICLVTGMILILWGLLPYLKARGIKVNTSKIAPSANSRAPHESEGDSSSMSSRDGNNVQKITLLSAVGYEIKSTDKVCTDQTHNPENMDDHRTIIPSKGAENVDSQQYFYPADCNDVQLPMDIDIFLFSAAVETVLETGQASVSMIQRRLKLGYPRAARLIACMEKNGIIGPFEDPLPRRILVSREQWEQMRAKIHISPQTQEFTSQKQNDFSIDSEKIVRDEENWRRECLGLSPVEYELQKIDRMEGHAFEKWCADLLQKNGFRSVEVTQWSGDHGVDIVAEKDGLKYAVQCKRYSSDLGNTPIQEVVAGKAFYHCHVAAVMTNQHFTNNAKELASVNSVLLWDRDRIIDMLKRELMP